MKAFTTNYRKMVNGGLRNQIKYLVLPPFSGIKRARKHFPSLCIMPRPCFTAYYFRKDAEPVEETFYLYKNAGGYYVTSLPDPKRFKTFVTRAAYDRIVRKFSTLPDEKKTLYSELIRPTTVVVSMQHREQSKDLPLSVTEKAVLADFLGGMGRRQERVFSVNGNAVPESSMTPEVISPLMGGLSGARAQQLMLNIATITAAEHAPIRLLGAFLSAGVGSNRSSAADFACSEIVPLIRRTYCQANPNP